MNGCYWEENNGDDKKKEALNSLPPRNALTRFYDY